jgi:hypothetical protein
MKYVDNNLIKRRYSHLPRGSALDRSVLACCDRRFFGVPGIFMILGALFSSFDLTGGATLRVPLVPHGNTN